MRRGMVARGREEKMVSSGRGVESSLDGHRPHQVRELRSLVMGRKRMEDGGHLGGWGRYGGFVKDQRVMLRCKKEDDSIQMPGRVDEVSSGESTEKYGSSRRLRNS